MKNLFTPARLAAYISFILSALLLGLVLMADHAGPAGWIWIAGAAVLFWAVSFVILLFSINTFIYNKIKPVYKTIGQSVENKATLAKNPVEKDMIRRVNHDVQDWADNKKSEIETLKQQEKFRKEFIGNLSHELKTPIFNIQGYVLTLLDGGLQDKSINKKYLERTEKSINRLISIIQDLEAISRLESGELDLAYEKFNIVQLAEDVIEMTEMTAKKKSISIVMAKKMQGKEIMVYADKKRIFHVLANLVSNSINYGTKNGKTTIAHDEMGDTVLIEVSDNGIGIADQHIPRLFERFYRVDKGRSREQGGTGLGLAIVKHILEAHNQQINVRSKLGQGSSFTFTLLRAL